MNILAKIISALRGASNEVGEAIVDTQAIRILEQETRDAHEQLDIAKASLTDVMAEKMAITRKKNSLQTEISTHENYAVQALEKNNETLALEVAGKLADLQNEFEVQSVLEQEFSAQVDSLKQSIANTERSIQAIERELSVVKTTESVQQANSAVAAKFSGAESSLHSATESLERIKAKQQKRSDRMHAAMELQQQEQGADLQQKLLEAGIETPHTSAQNILDQLRLKVEKS